jgi:hypothetical protein
LDSLSFRDIFLENDSLLNIDNLISEKEFREIAKEAEINPYYRENWIKNYYDKSKMNK